MAIISRLAVLLGLDAGEFNANLGKAKDKVEGFSTGAKVSLLAVGTAFAATAREAINFADKINDVAKANDMSVQSVLRMSQALSVNGGNTEDAGKLMASFSNKIDEAAEGSSKAQKAFLSIGVSLKDLRTLAPQELFEKTVKSLADVEDTTKRNALAMDMFGRAIRGVDIKGMADELDKNKNKFKESEEAFKSIGNSVDRLDRYFMNLKITIANSLAPAFEWLTKAMEEHQARSEKIVSRFQEIKKEAGWWAAFKDKEGIQKYVSPSERSYGSVSGASIPGIMSGIGGIAAPKKDIRVVKDDEILQKQKEFYAKEVAISQAKMGRLQIENQLAFAQENERKIALEYYDLQQKIILLRTEKKMTDQDIAKYAEVEKKRIMAMDKELEYQRTFEYGWQKAFASYAENASNSAKMAEQAFVSLQQNLEQTLTTFFETGKINFRSFISSIIHEIARLQAQKAAASILGLFGGGGNFLSDFFGNLNPFNGWSSGLATGGGWIPAAANGGDINGPTLVGERGPEIFVPNGSGTVIPNNRINSYMGNQPQVVYNGPYIANMSAIDTQSGLQFLAKNKQGVWAANQSAQRSLPQSR
jgi:hypothetical protein